MSIEKMREEFEAWARKMSMDLEYRNIPGVGQFYECPRTLLAFEAWQASRAAIEIKEPDDFTKGGNQNARILIAHHREIVKSWIHAIESLGLKVKS